MKKIAALAALSLVSLVVPAAAKPPRDHPAHSHRCKPHAVLYAAAGTLASGSLVKNDDGTLSGDLTVDVKRTNRNARDAKGTEQTYTLDHARVRLHGQDPANLAAGSRVRLLGRTTKLAPKCDATGFTATTTIRRAEIRAPRKPADS